MAIGLPASLPAYGLLAVTETLFSFVLQPPLEYTGASLRLLRLGVL